MEERTPNIAADPDTMTPEQLRDALADAAGWTRRGGKWDVKSGHDGPFASLGTMRAFEKGHPIPPLDSPEALGVVAGMMPSDWYCQSGKSEYGDGYGPAPAYRRWYANARHESNFDYLVCSGPTEAIARARLALKVLAVTVQSSAV